MVNASVCVFSFSEILRFLPFCIDDKRSSVCSQEVEFLVEAALLSDKVADDLWVLVIKRSHGAILL